MEKELPSLIRLLERSAKGSQEALKALSLEDGFRYTVPKPFDPKQCSKAEFEEQLLQTSFFAAAASRLGLEGCEEVACMAMRHMLYTYRCLYEKLPRLDEPLDGADLSEDTLEFIKDLCRTMDMLKKVEVKEAKRESQQKSAATAMTVTGQKQKRNEGKKDEKNDTEADDSTDDAYDPAKDSDTENTSSEDDNSAVERPAKKRKLSASPSKVKSPPATETTSSPSASPNVSGIHSHHQKKACPF